MQIISTDGQIAYRQDVRVWPPVGYLGVTLAVWLCGNGMLRLLLLTHGARMDVAEEEVTTAARRCGCDGW